MILLIILICLIVMAFGGGFRYQDYRGPSISLGTLLLVVLIVLLLTGALR